MHAERIRADRRGFTLIEAAVVLAVVLLLAALLTPVMAYIRENSRRMNCASNLRQIALSIKQYAQDGTEAFPTVWQFDWGTVYFPPPPGCANASLSMLYPDYIDNPKIFSCPSAPSEWYDIPVHEAIAETADTSYTYDPRHTDTHLSGVVLLAERTPGVAGRLSPNHGGKGHNICFLDTHVEWVTTDAAKYDRSIWTDDSAGGWFETDSYLTN